MLNFFRSKTEKDNDKLIELRNQLDSLQSKEQYLQLFQEITLTIVADLDFEEVSQKVVNLIVEKFDYASSVLFIVPEGKDYIYSHTVSDILMIKNVVDKFGKAFRDHKADLKTDNSLIVKAARENRIYEGEYLRDFVSPTLSEKLSDFTQNALRIKRTIALPLTTHGKLLGVIMFNSKKDHFKQEEIEALESFAKQLAISLRNSILYTRTKDQYESNQAMADLGHAFVEDISLETMSQKIADKVTEALGAVAGILFLADQERKILKGYKISASNLGNNAVKLLPKSLEEYDLDYAQPTNNIAKAAATGQMIEGPNMEEFGLSQLNPKVTKLVEKDFQTKRYAAVPLVVNQQVIGVMFYGFKEDSLSEDQLLKMQIFNNMAAQALANALNYRNTLEQKSRLEAKERIQNIIFRITNHLITTLNPAEVAKRSVDFIPKETGYLGAVLSLVNEKDSTFRAVAVTQTEFEERVRSILKKDYSDFPTDLSKADENNSAVVRALLDKETKIVKTIKETFYPSLPAVLAEGVQALLNVKSTISIPVKARDKVIGVMTFVLIDKSPEQLTEDDHGLMNVIVNQVGIALENANLLKKLELTSIKLKESSERYLQIAQEQKDQIDVMGHEVRTPLTVILQELNLLLDMILTEEKREQWTRGEVLPEDAMRVIDGLKSMSVAAKQEKAIVNNMLEAARIDKQTFELNYSEFDIFEILNWAIKESTKRLESKNRVGKITLNTNLDKLIVEADKSRIKQCIDGLFDNAEKYGINPEDQTLNIDVSVKEESGMAEISFKDHGIGIDPKDMDKLGKKFSRLNPYSNGSKLVRPGGTGLGLYTFKGIMEHHSGKLLIESDGVGKGSTFTLRFPMKKPAKPVEVKKPESSLPEIEPVL